MAHLCRAQQGLAYISQHLAVLGVVTVPKAVQGKPFWGFVVDVSGCTDV
jgi:hypothetical protein